MRATVLPERPRHLADRAGELVALPAPSSLEHRHRLAVLSEPARHDGAPEPGADHDDVVGVPHGLTVAAAATGDVTSEAEVEARMLAGD